MMHRNLDRRVETLLMLRDPGQIEFVESLITRGMSDEFASWRLEADGRWIRHHLDEEGQPLRDYQKRLIDYYAKKRRKASR